MKGLPVIARVGSILCAVDFSKASAKGLRYAVALSRAWGGRVTAIYAVDPLLAAAAAAGYDLSALQSRALTDLTRLVRTAVGARAAAGVQCVVATGKPGPVIVAEARRLRADVIVMGTNGLRGVQKLFFGSTTQAVLHRYAGPVLAIPPRCRQPRPAWPGRSIVTAVHGEAPPRADLIVLPEPRVGRLRMFRQGGAAYRFVCGARSPVLVVRTNRRTRRSPAAARPSRRVA